MHEFALLLAEPGNLYAFVNRDYRKPERRDWASLVPTLLNRWHTTLTPSHSRVYRVSLADGYDDLEDFH